MNTPDFWMKAYFASQIFTMIVFVVCMYIVVKKILRDQRNQKETEE